MIIEVKKYTLDFYHIRINTAIFIVLLSVRLLTHCKENPN